MPDATYRFPSLAGGLNDSRDPSDIRADQATESINVDYDRDSVRTTFGAARFGARTAPHSGIRTRVDPALSPLYVESGVSVPVRGYAMFPYSDRYDIGSDGVPVGTIGSGAERFHTLQGRSFSLSFSFRLPLDQALFTKRNGSDSGPVNNPADADVVTIDGLGGFDVALDDCILLLQKGGDRVTPMSWAIGLVNVADKLSYMTGSTWTGESTYVPVFIWLDAPRWSYHGPNFMEYSVAGGTIGNGEASYCTTAYRAILAEYAIEPGHNYHLSVDLQLDTGSPGTGLTPTPSWVGDGSFAMTVAREYGPATVNVADSSGITGLRVYKGPGDGIEYLKRYGVRYHGRDAMFAGVGMRQLPFADHGFIPTGADGASLEKGGHKFLDLSAHSAPTGHTLTASRGATEDFLEFNHRYLSSGNTEGGRSNIGISGADFLGLEYAPLALRNYWAVLYSDGAGDKWNGARFKLGDYEELGGPRYTIEADLSTLAGTFGARDVAIVPFRWRQVEYVMEGLRIFTRARDYTDPRTEWSLRSHTALDDSTEEDLRRLVAYWPLNDAEGASLRELIAGNTGYLFPFGLAGGSSGNLSSGGQVALSGEGEAAFIDLAEDPVLAREIDHALSQPDQAFAIEFSCIFPEATYSRNEDLGGGIDEAKYAPDLFTWEARDPDESGVGHRVRPLLRLTQRARWTTPASVARLPIGFQAFFADETDQEDLDEQELFTYPNRWSSTADWVGKRVTFQLGIQPGASDDSYTVYLSATPKGDLNAGGGADPQAEFAYFGTFRIERKDLRRSVITIGGAWNPAGARGYTELSARIILLEARVFLAPAPGGLPSLSGESVSAGKIRGGRALPRGPLEAEDLVHDLGFGLRAADVVDGSATVTAPGNSRFYEGDSNESLEGLDRALVSVAGDDVEVDRGDGLFDRVAEFYRVAGVASGGATLTLGRTYQDETRDFALARALRVVAYTAFGDDLTLRELSIGRGKGYDPATATVDDAVLSGELWFNLALPEVNWRARIYSPLASAALRDVLPTWTRGCKVPWRNPCLGVRTKDGDIYALFQGALYQADDRWRPNGGWQEEPEGALAFRQGGDLVRSAGAGQAWDLTTFGQRAIAYDAWLQPDEQDGIRTVLWVGDEATDPSQPAGTHGVQAWMRVRDGRPELAIGSTETYDGTSVPDDGLYVASADTVLERGVLTHVRWTLGVATTLLLEPVCHVNGRTVRVTVNQRANGLATPNWLTYGSDLVTTFTTPATWIGSARAAESEAPLDGGWTEDTVGPPDVRADLMRAWHTWSGLMAGVAVHLVDTNDLVSPTGFDPRSVTYGLATLLHLPMSEGQGHVLYDAQDAQRRAILESSPFISRFHEAGRSELPSSWGLYLDQLYVTNGRRPIVVDERLAKHAGVLVPTTRPSYTVRRRPVFVENVQADSPNGAENGPIDAADAGADPRLWHLSSHGNTYWSQRWHAEVRWENAGDGTDDYDVFAFKCYVRMRSVAGRIPLYSQRASLSSGGPFVEIRDGKLVVGWYDTNLKEEVWAGTSQAVIEPGFVHYIHVRKVFPRQSGGAGSSNWYDSIFEDTAASTNDVMVVRRFPKAAAAVLDLPLLAATIHATDGNICSFTTEDGVTKPAGTTAAGLISNQSTLYSGAAAGVVTADSGAPFHRDMVGRYWQWGTGAGAFAGLLYRVATYTSSSQIAVVALDGTTPDFTGLAADPGGVFLGTSIVKSDRFDESTSPDTAAYDVELFGSSLVADEANGLAPFDGEWWSAAWHVARRSGSEAVDIFQTAIADRIQTGSDVFPEDIYDPGVGTDPGPGELRAGGANTYSEVSCQPYGGTIQPVSPEPNEDHVVEVGPQSSSNASNLDLRYVLAPEVLQGAVRIQVAFYDRDQAIVGNGGPELVIEAGEEDALNPSNDVTFLLTGLPVSRASGRIERWIYASLPGGTDKWRVAVVPDNSSDAVAVVVTGRTVRRDLLLEHINGPPPLCAVLGVAQDSLWYGALEDGPELLQWSRRFFPAQVPRVNILPLVGTGTGPITAISEIRGRAVVQKRDATWRIAVEGGRAFSELVSRRTGALSSQSVVDADDRLEMLADRGLYVYSGQGLPAWVGQELEEFFTGQFRRDRAGEVSAAADRRKNQYLTTILEQGVLDRGLRMSAELDEEGQRFRFGRYEDPWITALDDLQDPVGGVQRVIGGTRDGSLVHLDAMDGRVLTPEGSTWSTVATAAARQTSTKANEIPLEPPLNFETNLESLRGRPVRWMIGRGTALFVSGNSLYLDDEIEDPPATGAKVTIGVQEHRWASRWDDLGAPEMAKTIQYVDLVGGVAGTGTGLLVVERDFGAAVWKCPIDWSEEEHRFFPEIGAGQHFRFTLESENPATEVRWDVSKLIVRMALAEQTD